MVEEPEDTATQADPSFSNRARQAVSKLGDDERIRRYSGSTVNAARKAAAVSTAPARKLSQAEAWEQVHATVGELSEIVRIQHALIVDLRDRVAALEADERADS